MAQRFHRSKLRGACGKLRHALPASSDSTMAHAIKCAGFTMLFLLVAIGLLIWSAS